jgi:hypothetical protein
LIGTSESSLWGAEVVKNPGGLRSCDLLEKNSSIVRSGGNNKGLTHISLTVLT